MSQITNELLQKHFMNLYHNWYKDEWKYYAEWEIIEGDPDDIPLEELKECNYKDLRILKVYFENLLGI